MEVRSVLSYIIDWRHDPKFDKLKGQLERVAIRLQRTCDEDVEPKQVCCFRLSLQSHRCASDDTQWERRGTFDLWLVADQLIEIRTL